MRKRRATKTERLTLAVEPQLRASIEAEAAGRHVPMSSIVRTMLRDQLAAISARVDRVAA
jgi:hypothetical protein